MEQQEYHKAINSHLAQEKEVLNNTTTYSIVLDNLRLFQSEQSKAFAYLNQSLKIREENQNDRV
jgi:hypothetical protein